MKALLVFAHRQVAAVAVLTIASAIIGIVLVSRVSFDPNVLRLLPQRTQSVQAFRQFLQNFGSLDQLYILFDAPGPIGEHADFVDAYVSELRQVPEVQSVDSQLFEPGKDWSYLSDRELFLLGAADAAAALERFRPPRIDRELVHTRELLTTPSDQVRALVQQDPLGLLTMLRNRLGRSQGFISFDPTQEGYVSKDGRSRLLIVKPTGHSFDSDFCKALFRRLATVESAARARAAEDDPDLGMVKVEAAGAYRVALEAEELIRHEGIVNTVASIALLLAITLAVFRTPWVMIYGLAPLALASLLTLGINGIIHGSLSPATSGSAGLLFGLGIDGVILLYMRYLEERGAGATTDEAIPRMSGTAVSVVLAQMTSVATFLALLLIDFPTLQDLGSLVGLGMFICCGATLVILPACLPRRSGSVTRGAITTPWLGRLVTRGARPIVWISLFATVVLSAASTRLRFDTSIEKLQAQTQGATLEDDLAQRFSLPKNVLLTINEHPDIEALLATDARLTETFAARAPQVAVASAAFILPSATEQERVAEVLIASRTTSDVAADNIRRAAHRAGFREDTFEPFLKRLATLLDPSERITYAGLMSHGLDSIVSRFVVHRDGVYRLVTYLYPQGTVDIDTLRGLIADVDPDLRLTGLPVINHELRRQFLPQFLKGLVIGIMSVAILVYVVFRTLRHTILALLPTALGFVWSAGILALGGVQLDLFSLFAAITFFGIAVDYGIYVLGRSLIDGTSNMNDVMTKTGAAITVACATALVGFGTLINSSYAPLHQFGIVSLVTLTCCLVASIVTLPAVVVRVDQWSSLR